MKKILHFISLHLLQVFFEKKLLKGKYFDYPSFMGHRYAWKFLLFQKIFRYNSKINWPISPFSVVSDSNNIEFDPNDMQNFWHYGCYYQNFNAKIVIGKGTYIAPNVGIITANHNKNNLDKHDKGQDVIIGSDCWIGMNSVILPGVILGNRTIVGAGSIVTKSFPEGNCIIVGNPAHKQGEI